MSEAKSLLEAGGLVPLKTKIGPKEPVDQISARCYSHPALGDQPVVRLTADSLAQGDDLVMEFLGFEEPTVKGPLALRRRQALGFPEWALIHDPDHAKYALELVKEFKKEARRAKSKPGHAYDAFTKIAKRLGTSVAHFLPSFWEEVGRVYLAEGNTTYASRSFGKAREAEKIHALEVDEELRANAFLEFALAGGLSNKSLIEYSKDLLTSDKPEAAWSSFRELCIKRTLGGMPPWTSMAKDLKPVIKAADLDYDKEIELFLAEIAESPALSRSPMGFWKTASSSIKKLVKTNHQVAGVLLNLVPDTSQWDRSDIWKWIDHLEDWDILKYAWEKNIPEEAQPKKSPAAWLSRVVTRCAALPDKAFELLRAMADRLKEEEEPLDLEFKRWSRSHINVDLLDLALELGIPVRDLPDEPSGPDEEFDYYEGRNLFDLTDWASTTDSKEERPRDPIHIAKDKRFQGMLAEAVPFAIGNGQFDEVAIGKKGLAEARKLWLTTTLKKGAEGGLPDLQDLIDEIQGKTSVEVFREFSDTFPLLEAIQTSEVLARTIQTGIIDEWGWPKLEEVVKELNPQGKDKIQFFGSFPYVIVSNGLHVKVLKQDQIVYEHELQLKKKEEVRSLCFFDGQLCVLIKDDNYNSFMYWSETPKTRHETYGYGYDQVSGYQIELEEGGSWNGNKPIHAGAKSFPDSCSDFLFDGEHGWVQRWEQGKYITKEVDFQTGKLGRTSLPKFLDDYVEEGKELVISDCTLMHDGDLKENSLLGIHQGNYGFRVRKTRRNTYEAEGIDGRSWSGSLANTVPRALLDQAESKEKLPISLVGGYLQYNTFWDPSGTFRFAIWERNSSPYQHGQPCGLPIHYLHYYKVRDPFASKDLRSFTNSQAARLLKAAAEDLTERKQKSGKKQKKKEQNVPSAPHLEAELEKQFPSLKHDGIRQGLIGLILYAADLDLKLHKLIASRDPEGEHADETSSELEALVWKAKETLSLDLGWGESAPPFVPAINRLTRYLTGETEEAEFPARFMSWYTLLDNLPPNVWRIYWEQEAKDDAWLTFLEEWSKLPVHNLPGEFRYLELDAEEAFVFQTDEDDDDDDWFDEDDGTTYAQELEEGANRFLFQKSYWNHWYALEYAPHGKFTLPAHLKITSERVLNRSWSADQIQQFAILAKANEKPFLSLEALQLTAEKVGVSSGEIALVWSGYPRFSSWESNFLPKALREKFGLKVKEAKEAKQALESLSHENREKLLSEILNVKELSTLWSSDESVIAERIVSAFQSAVPKRIQVPNDVINLLDRVIPYGVDMGAGLEAFAAPQSHPLLTSHAKWKLEMGEEDYSPSLHCDQEGETFDSSILTLMRVMIPLLNYNLPVGDHARNNIPEVLKSVRKCLASPDLLLQWFRMWHWTEKNDYGKKLLTKIFGDVKQVKDAILVDDGVVAVSCVGSGYTFAFRPAKVDSDEVRERMVQIISSVSKHELHDEKTVRSAELMSSAGFSKIAERILDTPVPEGSWESNPLLSVPHLVPKVCQKYDLSENAGILYLQLLTLPDCTSKKINLWNGWTTSVFKKASKELLEKELVLEAKRSRAGRTIFLPGGWEALKIPHLPLETWKLKLYEVTRTSEGKLNYPVLLILPLQPVHDLFEQAWHRIETGDEPRYDEV